MYSLKPGSAYMRSQSAYGCASLTGPICFCKCWPKSMYNHGHGVSAPRASTSVPRTAALTMWSWYARPLGVSVRLTMSSAV